MMYGRIPSGVDRWATSMVLKSTNARMETANMTSGYDGAGRFAKLSQRQPA